MIDFILPSAEQKKKILSAIDYTEERLKNDVKKLREWLEKQPHLPNDASDDFLSSFVVGMKSVERAKERLDAYYTAKSQYKVVFDDLDPKSLYEPDPIQQFVTPGMTKDGNRVFYMRVLPGTDPDQFHHLSVVKRQLMLTMLGLEKDPISGGFMAVYDFKGVSAAFLSRWSLQFHTIATRCLQDTMPLRIKKVLIINCLPAIVKVYDTIVKPLLKKKLADRITLISNCDAKEISKHIPIEFLPEDMGGTAPKSQELSDEWVRLMHEHKDFFLKEQGINSNEKLRPGKPKFTAEDVFGVEGNFRTLSID